MLALEDKAGDTESHPMQGHRREELKLGPIVFFSRNPDGGHG
jgi:hypothetical protein